MWEKIILFFQKLNWLDCLIDGEALANFVEGAQRDHVLPVGLQSPDTVLALVRLHSCFLHVRNTDAPTNLKQEKKFFLVTLTDLTKYPRINTLSSRGGSHETNTESWPACTRSSEGAPAIWVVSSRSSSGVSISAQSVHGPVPFCKSELCAKIYF